MSLARKKDSELLQAFEGCFEGDEYKGEIDDDLFLAQVSGGGALIHGLSYSTLVRCLLHRSIYIPPN